MTPKQKENYNNMRKALRLIWKYYQTPSQLRNGCEKEYGLEDYTEALEMAYENIKETARMSVKGIREII